MRKTADDSSGLAVVDLDLRPAAGRGRDDQVVVAVAVDVAGRHVHADGEPAERLDGEHLPAGGGVVGDHLGDGAALGADGDTGAGPAGSAAAAAAWDRGRRDRRSESVGCRRRWRRRRAGPPNSSVK